MGHLGVEEEGDRWSLADRREEIYCPLSDFFADGVLAVGQGNPPPQPAPPPFLSPPSIGLKVGEQFTQQFMPALPFVGRLEQRTTLGTLRAQGVVESCIGF